jgi:hypothetical protein
MATLQYAIPFMYKTNENTAECSEHPCAAMGHCGTLPPEMPNLIRRTYFACRALLVLTALVGAVVEVSAQFGSPVDVTPTVGAPAWKTEVIQFEPRHGLHFQQAAEDPEPSRAWKRFLRLPATDASEREVIAHIQKQTAMAKRLLNNSGFTLPPGTAILWDEGTGTLAVRSTHEVVEWLRSLGSESRQELERNVSNTLRVVQAEGAFLREIARETTMQFDQASAWKRLEKLVAEGEAPCPNTDSEHEERRERKCSNWFPQRTH